MKMPRITYVGQVEPEGSVVAQRHVWIQLNCEISKYGLLVQLANLRLSQHDREAMNAVLTHTSDQQQQQQIQQTFQTQIDLISNNILINQLENLQNLVVVQQTATAHESTVPLPSESCIK
ncbi:hypothetical protein GQX74_010962 [Glossina fuscipes]|nr:hypothetical protein GQX74_010962 [Glossina fuscipes]